MTPPPNSDTGANSLASNAYVSMQILTAILTAILILYLKTNLIKRLPSIIQDLITFTTLFSMIVLENSRHLLNQSYAKV